MSFYILSAIVNFFLLFSEKGKNIITVCMLYAKDGIRCARLVMFFGNVFACFFFLNENVIGNLFVLRSTSHLNL